MSTDPQYIAGWNAAIEAMAKSAEDAPVFKRSGASPKEDAACIHAISVCLDRIRSLRIPGPKSAGTPITEDWLKANGFKWHQLDRQPNKHWLLWLGAALKEKPALTSFEDIGLELAPAYNGEWFCWFRSDAAGRYHRFIHLRHLTTTDEVVALVEAITGRSWSPENHFYGSAHNPEHAARIRRDLERADAQLTLHAPAFHKWSDIEKDDTRGRALPEHYEAHEKGRKGP